MFKVDTFRLIKRTIRRFLSLVLIVLIGVAFMMGLMSNPTIMRKSVDKYNDENNLHDIQLYSPYGFCYEDVDALLENKDIEKVFASRTIDTYCYRKDGTKIVARISEAYRNLDKIVLSEGRLPTDEYECVILNNMNSESSYEIGDYLTLTLDEDDEIENYLKRENFKIVGFVNSPEYISKVLGTSNLKNQELDLLIYVPNSNLISDYYTTIYLTLKDSKNLLSYTDEYSDFISENKITVENTAIEQQDYLKTKIVNELQEEIDEGKAELEEQRAEGQKELDDAKKQLEEANIQIVMYESTMDLLDSAIKRASASIQEDEYGINNTIGEIDSYLNIIGTDTADIYETYVAEYATEQYDTAVQKYNEIKRELRSARNQYEKGLQEYKEAVLTFNDEIAKADAEIRKAEQDLSELPEAKWTILDRDSHYSSLMYDGTCKQMTAIGFAMPFIFFLVAALVCMTTMTRLVDEQRGQIGIYSALGYSKLQITSKYVIYAFLAAIIGGIIGIFIGQLIFPTVIYSTWRLMYNLPKMIMSFPVIYILISLLSFVILMMGITAFVVHKTTKTVPSTLMRPKPPKSGKEIVLEKVEFIWKRLSFTSKITARNIFRYKSRFLMTVIGVAGCTALLVVGWGIKDSIADIIEIQFGNIFGYDYQIYLDDNHDIQEKIEILKEDMDNEYVVPFMQYTSKVYIGDQSKAINTLVFNKRDASDVLGLRKTDRKSPVKLDNAGVVLSQKFALNNNIKKGDYILIESKEGIKANVKVSEICEMYFQHYIFMSNECYEAAFEESVYDSNIAVLTNNSDNLKLEAEQLDGYQSMVDFSLMIEQFEIMIQALDVIILVIILTAGSLAFVVIMNLSQVNISEREREIATLKVLGFHDLEVDRYIYKEIILLTIIGGFIGLPLGVVEHHFIMNVINMEMVMFGMNISTLSFTYAYSITLVFTLIVLLFMKKTLKNIDMIESLKSIE